MEEPKEALQRTAATGIGLPGREVTAAAAAAELGRTVGEIFMTAPSGPLMPRENLFERIWAYVTLQTALHKLEVWLNRKLKTGVYELHEGKIVAGRGQRPDDRINVNDITAWQIHAEMVFDIIVIELSDGQVRNWFDKYNDLISILRMVAPDREAPWTRA